MIKKLFLLDGMALAYRAHFALMSRPIFTSQGVNASALFGFTQTLLEIRATHQPTHLMVAFDTAVPTHRHQEYPAYKAQREAMPEDLSRALPQIRRMIEALRIPVVACDGWEADDVIGTLVRRAEKEGFESYMVTPDKDFGQLVSDRIFLLKPSRMGEGIEILGVAEILKKWGIQRPEQVIDVLALWGDASDNIPGVPGIGEKTAAKLIGQYGSVENLLAHGDELSPRLKASIEEHRSDALLSKRLATIVCDVPCGTDLEQFRVSEPDHDGMKRLLREFEFNAIGRRLYGEAFKAGHGYGGADGSSAVQPVEANESAESKGETGPDPERAVEPVSFTPVQAALKAMGDLEHDYRVVTEAVERDALLGTLKQQRAVALFIEASNSDPKQAEITGVAFAFAAHTGFYLPMPGDESAARHLRDALRLIWEDERIAKVGHDLKFACSVLRWQGVALRGRLFDSLLAHSLIEPDLRHSLEYLAEAHLGYSLTPTRPGAGELIGEAGDLGSQPLARRAEHAMERADVAWQMRSVLEPMLRAKGQERVCHEIEEPLLPVLVDMECEGIRVDAGALAEISRHLTDEMTTAERRIYGLAGTEFNLNSPKQLGEILFEGLKIADKPKKTKTGQYATDEPTLSALAADHPIVTHLLEYREMSKLKSTYVDALPASIWPKTGRVHTTYHQVATSTGRLNSQNPNLQNIPIRGGRGREIRRAFVPRNDEYRLLSADYSQIELRIIAALSREAGLLEAFRSGGDVHTATAARVFGVFPDLVTSEMRRQAKMVNYGIAYGISAFGLAQRLGIPRKAAAQIIDQYFAQFPGIRHFMNETIASAQRKGYVETVTGRRRYLREILSSNATVRAAAERNAINAPIQGTAADMIKIAMTRIHRELNEQGWKTRMLLQVHDELVFDLHQSEQAAVVLMVEEKMKTALPLDVPIVVEIEVGQSWLEAH